jgi:TRAP-type C4-dicarboxylate transport system substrate-binding protein
MKIRTFFATTAIALVGMVASAAHAEDVTKLKFASFLPATHTGTEQGSNVFMKAAKEASGGAIDFEFYPGGQAGKALQLWDLVRSGAIDMAEIAGGYISSDKSPLLGIMELPGPNMKSCQVAGAMKTMASEGGAIHESDFKPAGIRALAFYPYPAYGPAASTKKVTSVEDLAGMKMRNAGGLQELTVQAVGGVAVKMPSPEVYQSLQRGTLDAVLFSFLSVRDYDLASIADYGVTGWSFGTPGTLTFISEKAYQSLPKELQDALTKAGMVSSDHWCDYVDTKEVEYIADAESKGMEIYTWSKDDVAKLNELTANIPNDWAAGLDARGKPGTAVLDEFRSLTSK